MDKLKAGIRRYRLEIFPGLKPRLEKLMKEGQRPEVLVVACSDSRVKLADFTQADPGDIFVVRNAGNVVPPWGVHPSGVAASIEYAASVLPIRDIIIAGHTGCGAMDALRRPEELKDLSAVRDWLSYAPLPKPCDDAKQQLLELTRSNVQLQLEHLRGYPCIRARGGRIGLHGWIYSIETGEVWEDTRAGWRVID
jgi:carbonic anhydrase